MDGRRPGESLDGDTALAELAWRYFSSHGPATFKDFVWWSGLRVGDARAGLEAAKPRLRQETVDDQPVWFPSNDAVAQDPSPTAYLLPGFDEYYLGYQDRSALLDAQFERRAVSSNGVFRPMIVIDGQVVGIWRPSRKRDLVTVKLEPFRALTDAESQAVTVAAGRYGAFLGLPITLATELP